MVGLGQGEGLMWRCRAECPPTLAESGSWGGGDGSKRASRRSGGLLRPPGSGYLPAFLPRYLTRAAASLTPLFPTVLPAPWPQACNNDSSAVTTVWGGASVSENVPARSTPPKDAAGAPPGR